MTRGASLMRVAIAVAALLALPATSLHAQVVTAPPPDESARPIALSEAVRMAQRNAPAAVAARGQERSARADVTSAYGAFIPNVSVSMGGVRQFTAAGTRYRYTEAGDSLPLRLNPWTYSNGLSFNVDIFDGGRRFYAIRTAKSGVSAAEATQIAQGFTVALNVQQQYFAVLAAHESEDAARAQVAESGQQLEAAGRRLAAGAATLSDSLRSVILVGNAQLALLTAQNSLRVANATLTRLVASPELVTASRSDTLAAAPITLDSAALSALAGNGPLIRQAEAQLTAARAERRAARAPYLPSISASYSRSGNGPDARFGYGDEAFPYQGSLRLSLSYPLFNQFNREAGVVRAAVAEDNADAQLRDARLASQQLLIQALSTLRTAEQRIAIQLASVRAAEEDLRVQGQRYSLGAGTLLDQLTSQTQLSQARAGLIQARYDARVARAQLESVVGRVLE